MSVIIKAEMINKKVSMGKDNQLHILKDVDLEIKKGEFISVMGPSGSGKSTLLYNISSMDNLSSGTVRFNGKEMQKLREEELSNIRLSSMGFVFQDIHLLKNLTLIDNIVYPAFVHKKMDKEAMYKKAENLMKMTGIEHLAHNMTTQASGGQLQRAAICRALINNPEIIFADEPTGSLDSKSAQEIMDLLAQIHKTGTSIMLVTHDASVASWADRILFMRDGAVIGDEDLSQFKKDDLEKRTEAVINLVKKYKM